MSASRMFKIALFCGAGFAAFMALTRRRMLDQGLAQRRRRRGAAAVHTIRGTAGPMIGGWPLGPLPQATWPAAAIISNPSPIRPRCQIARMNSNRNRDHTTTGLGRGAFVTETTSPAPFRLTASRNPLPREGR